MSASTSRSSEPQKSENHQPKSLVFVNAGSINDIHRKIELVAIHIEELKAEGKPRVLDKLVLEYPQQCGETCIEPFLKLQAEPVCFIVESEKINQLQFLKACLQNAMLQQDLWYAHFVIDKDQNTSSPEKRTTFSVQSSEDEKDGKSAKDFCIIDWANTHQTFLLESLQPKPFSGLVGYKGIHTRPKQPSRGNSLIFLDLETTDLDKRNITEICMVKVCKEDLLFGAVPADYDKMVLTMDPGFEIEDKASELSGLNRFMLMRSQKKPFDEDWLDCVIGFIKRHSGPACLVAHAGNMFDFEVLVNHLTCSSNVRERLCDVKSYDTLVGFKQMRGRSHGLSLAALYSSCSDGEKIPNSHTAEGDVMALMKVVACNPGVLDKVKEAGLFRGVVNRERRERVRKKKARLRGSRACSQHYTQYEEPLRWDSEDERSYYDDPWKDFDDF